MRVYNSAVEVASLADPVEFLDRAQPLLLADEARHNLILGLAGTLRDNRTSTASTGCGSSSTAARWSEPRCERRRTTSSSRVALTEAQQALASAIGGPLPGVTAGSPRPTPSPTPGRRRPVCAAGSASRSGSTRSRRSSRWRTCPARRGRRPTPTGRCCDLAPPLQRRAPRDETGRGAHRALLDHRLGTDSAGYAIWEDGLPVSLAGFSGETPNGVRIGPVYTPPVLRSRGYGSAVTAAVSAERLAAGRRFCFLYTDAANPTSNKIYTQIGYEPVCDAFDYAFRM